MSLMTYKHDIFISYGRIDDEDPAGTAKGWVNLLVERLPGMIAGNLGYKPKIWRDERSLRGNDLLRAAIEDGASLALLFIPIVSPRYVQSQWCRTELERFCTTVSPPGVPSHTSRIFKVIKTPPLLSHLAEKEPKPLRDLIGYSFYEMEGDMPTEFSPDVVPTKDLRYWNALRRLAWDISNMLVVLKQEPELSGSAAAGVPNDAATLPSVAVSPALKAANSPSLVRTGVTNAKWVYLAETTSDLTKERELVRDELRQRGYRVLPEHKLPLDSQDILAQAVRADLARCALSVHFVGARYGLTPEDDARSIVCIQEALAGERGKTDKAFQRLLWMPPGLATPSLEINDERQRSFISQLQNRVTSGAELLQTSVEDLKTRIIEKLNPTAGTLGRPDRRSKLKQVYLICENRDRGSVRPIKEYLFKEDLEVITWLDKGIADELMDYHRKNLRECDAALIYFGSGDEPWVRKNLEDLEKAYGYGREQDWSARAVYVGSPPNEQKEDFLTHMVPYVIRNFSSFDPTDLRDFVRAVRATEGGPQ
jgi:uncharacterized protein DUF4062